MEEQNSLKKDFLLVESKKQKMFLSVFFLMLGFTIGWAQTINVRGSVKDVLGEPIIGANIFQKGTTNGVISDIDGKFVLSVPDNAILTVSYLGYIPQDVALNGKANVEVILQEDTKTLDEVVVIGFGT